jgi:hypothetical protein
MKSNPNQTSLIAHLGYNCKLGDELYFGNKHW